MNTITIGGVPEHFNLPWHLAIEQGLFERENIHLIWKDYPGGTGAMCADLRAGKLDIALVLTEGIVADIVKGNPARILRWYVKSPLIWGIHVAADSAFYSIDDLQGRKYAISRFGSGSHLMAYVDASSRGWELSEEKFVVAGDLGGAKKILTGGEADIFLWEKFTTQPLVDAGIFRRIGECPTPWPCFAMAVTGKIAEDINVLDKIISVICRSAENLKSNHEAHFLIAERYGIKEDQAKEWLNKVEWETDRENIIHQNDLYKVQRTLSSLKLIDRVAEIPDLVCNATKVD